MEKLRIYIVCNFDDFGGVEKVSLNLARRLLQWHEVHLVSDKPFLLETDEVEVIPFRKIEEPDVVIFSKKKDILRSFLHAPLIFRKMILWRHLPVMRKGSGWVSRMLDKGLIWLAVGLGRGVVFLCEEMAELDRPAFFRNSVQVIPNLNMKLPFHRAEATKPIAPGVPIKALYLFRDDPQKRLDVVLEVAEACEKELDLDVWVRSADDYASTASANLKFRSFSADFESALADYDLILLASNYEGLPTILLEGLAKGVPFIANDCPTGPADIHYNTGAGFLVEELTSEKYSEKIREIHRIGLAAHSVNWSAFEEDSIIDSWNQMFGE